MQSKSQIATESGFAIAAGQIRLQFEHGDEGTILRQLTDAEGNGFLRRENVFWKIEMMNQEHKVAELDMRQSPPVIRRGSDQVRLTWRDVAIGTSAERVTVKATLLLNDSAGEVRMQLRVEDVPDEWSVYRVHFPRLDLAVKKGSQDDAMIMPLDRGAVFRDPLATMPTGGIMEKVRRRPYPQGNHTMQFAALQRGDQLLYIGAHDPDAHLKTFFIGPDAANELIYIHPYSDTEIHYGEDWAMPYPWVLRVQRGDWYDVAQIYRKFALTTPWTKSGPLAGGKSTPLWYQQIGLVSLRLLRGPGFEDDDVLAEQAFMGTPMVCHYYMWHQSAFDANYPLFFPENPTFRNTIKLLEANDIHVMPYINMFSCDMHMDAWKQGLKGSAMQINPQGDHDLHVWSQNRTFATLCPSAAMTRYLSSMTASRLFEQGVSAIYFDEIAMSAAWPCHDTRHNHPAGGGPMFVREMNKTLDLVRSEANAIKKDGAILSTEGCAEPYIGSIDSFAMGNANRSDAVPLFEAVYHDHVMGFGRYTYTSELTDPRFLGSIESKHAQQFVWGTQFGWSDVPLSRIIEKLPAAGRFLRHLGHTWKHSYDFLAQGQLLRPLDLSDQLDPVTRKWAVSWLDETGTDVTLMPVLNSVWKRIDGSIGVVLVNITDEPQSVVVRLASIQAKYAEAMRNCVPADFDAATLSRTYPLPQRAAGEVRRVVDDKLVVTIAEGDSERGFPVTLEPMSALVVAMGSEKFYGLNT